MKPFFREKTLAILALLTAPWTLGGCVSSSKYKDLQSQDNAKLASLQKQYADLQKTLDEAKKAAEDVKKNLSQAQDKNGEYERKINETNVSLDKTVGQLKQTTDDREQLRKSNEELSKALAAKSGELSKKVSALNDEKQALEKKVAELTQAAEELKAKEERELAQTKSTYDSLVGQLKSEISDGQVKITQIQGKLTVNVADKIFFDSGKAEIKEDGRKVLLRVADVLKHVTDKRISIEGHTDNKPLTAALQEKYPTNWELSTARSTTVARFLQEQGGIDPTLLSAVGYGEYHPIATNGTLEGRGQNRRIEIVLLDKEVGLAKGGGATDAGQPKPTDAAPAK